MTYLTYRALGGNGRLGNQLFQLASTLGLAASRGQVARFPSWPYAPWFSVPAEFFECPAESEDLGFDYLQDLRLFAHVEADVRRYLAPSPSANTRLSQAYPWMADLSETISLHVRRGDSLGKEKYHPILPLSYYETALAGLPDVPVLVFSDDIKWCRAHFSPQYTYVSPQVLDHRQGNPTDVMELLLMARCSYHVIANSTFSWWGAFLSGGEVRYPAVWYGPLLSDIDWRLMIPSAWIEVPCG